MIRCKKSVSDAEWVGDINGHGFAFFQERSTFDFSLTPDNGPKATERKVLESIRINIDACEERIRTHPDHAMIMRDLNNEYNKLLDPISIQFHWDLSIYENCYDGEFDIRIQDNAAAEYLKLSEDIRNRQHEPNLFKITHKSGREKYNANDMVVLRTSLILIDFQI